jgi:cellulose synthase/poly-beta-1,6-N-acetylglucosamine synthase-like glycosyltransferase
MDRLPGRRVWVEAIRRGQVVGVLETGLPSGRIDDSVRSELSATFPDDGEETPRLPDHALPRASVVVPTVCNDPRGLARTVESLLSLDYPDFEVIVVDNRPDAGRDRLPEFQDSRLRTTEEPKRGISAARNRGLACATGDIVAFTDDDVVVDRGWLRAIGSRFALDRAVDAIGGLVLPTELQTAPQLWFEEFYGGFTRSFHADLLNLHRERPHDPLFPYAPAMFGAGCNMAFRRTTLESMGGFVPALGTGTPARGGEDLAMFIELVTAGGTIAIEPGALVRHRHRRTEREFFQQVFSYGVGLTAMFAAIVTHNPRHVGSLLRRVPAGLRLLVRPRAGRSPSRRPSYPKRVPAYQVLGMVVGPLAYLHSVARNRWAG